MATCPNCAAMLDVHGASCPTCKADFGGANSWKPIATTEEIRAIGAQGKDIPVAFAGAEPPTSNPALMVFTFLSDAVVLLAVGFFIYGYFIEPSFVAVIAIWVGMPFAFFSLAAHAVAQGRVGR